MSFFLLAWSFIASKDAMPLALVMDPTSAAAAAATATAPGALLINHNQHQKERGILKRGERWEGRCAASRGKVDALNGDKSVYRGAGYSVCHACNWHLNFS